MIHKLYLELCFFDINYVSFLEYYLKPLVQKIYIIKESNCLFKKTSIT